MDLALATPYLIAMRLQAFAAAVLIALGAQPTAAHSDAATQIDRALTEAARQDAFSGAVLVARNGETIYRGAFGMASREYDRPNHIDTQFSLASVNKSMTAIAVMRLVEQGKLSLDDSIDMHLGQQWLPVEHAKRITIAHLLSHTSGLGDYLDKIAAQRCGTLAKLDDYRPLIATDAPEFEPGSRSRYSNVGYLLLGAIIEAATGEDYDAHMRRTLYAPLGMHHTRALDMGFGHRNLAQGYSKVPLLPFPERRLSRAEVAAHLQSGFAWRNNSYRCSAPGTPAGGYYSTVDDMFRFARALQAGKLVSDETLTTMRRSFSPDNPNYGLGFTTRGDHIGHSGSFPGSEARYRIYPDGHIIIVLANLDGSVAEAFDLIGTSLGIDRP